jgi:hypothetical protein
LSTARNALTMVTPGRYDDVRPDQRSRPTTPAVREFRHRPERSPHDDIEHDRTARPADEETEP